MGFDFTKDELETVRTKLKLSDDELENISGGAMHLFCKIDDGIEI